MRTLDRYIVRTFLVTTGLWFLVVMSLRVAIDLFINMDEFVERSPSLAEAFGNIVEFYSYQLLVYVNEMGGIVVLLGANTTLYMLNRTNELVAMLASGVSLHRVIFPVVICSMLLSVVIVVDQELLIPRVAHKLVRDQGDVAHAGKGFPVRLMPDGAGNVWFAPWYFPEHERMGGETDDGRSVGGALVILRDEKERYEIARVTGGQAVADVDHRSGGWRFSDGQLIRVVGDKPAWHNLPNDRQIYTRQTPEALSAIIRQKIADHRRKTGTVVPDLVPLDDVNVWDTDLDMRLQAEKFIPGPTVDLRYPSARTVRTGTLIRPRFTFYSDLAEPADGSGEPAPAEGAKVLAIIEADSATWRPRSSNREPDDHWGLDNGSIFCPSDLTPYDLLLRESSHWMDYMSVRNLRDLLSRRRIAKPALATKAIHVRATQPVVNLVMLLLGVPFLLSRERNIKASALFCGLAVLTFQAAVLGGKYMIADPAWGAWLPILVFGPIAAVLVDSIKT